MSVSFDKIKPGLTIGEILASLPQVVANLDDLDTKLSELIVRTEDLLRAHISTRIALDANGQIIAFGKLNGKWHLLVDDEPLLNCSRQVRVEVFTAGLVEALIRTVPKQLEIQISERRQAIAVAELIIDALTGEKSC